MSSQVRTQMPQTQKKDKRSKSKGKKFDKNACLLVFVLIFFRNPDFSSVDSE